MLKTYGNNLSATTNTTAAILPPSTTISAVKLSNNQDSTNDIFRHISESNRRIYEKLHRDFGTSIISLLKDPDVNEIILNPDSKLWVDRTSTGQNCIDVITTTQAFSIIHAVASLHNFVINQHNPQLEAELPHYQEMQGERFTGQIPPIVTAPCFTIRKKSATIFSLEDYFAAKLVTLEQITVLRQLIKERKNILVCGGPGAGKTTVTNALIIEAVKCDKNQRFLLLEDLPELQCTAANKVAMLTSNNIDMTGLLRTAVRMRPDRILIGEVRGKEALTMLKAWNTGCPGGICTVHANSAIESIQRILDLTMEAGLTVPPTSLVLHTVNAVVSVVRKGNQKGFINEIVKLKEDHNENCAFEKLG